MTEREAFIEAIAADPGDDTARLAFADWLDEHGEEDRAEFVRIQCAIARRPQPPDDRFGYVYGVYPSSRNPSDSERAQAARLLLKHWPEWFGGVLSATGMPAPGSPVSPRRPGEPWRYGPYFLEESYGSTALLPLLFKRNYDAMHRPVSRPQFLEYLRTDRGFVTGLGLALAYTPSGGSLAGALRREPIDGLDIRLDAGPDLWWDRLSHPLLKRVRTLGLKLAEDHESGLDFSDAAGRLLNDPHLSGVRDLTFHGPPDDDDGYPGLALPPGVAEALVSSAVARGCASLDARLDAAGLTLFTNAEPLPSLRRLSLDAATEEPAPLDLFAYRNWLEELDLSGERLDLSSLGVGPPWARLTRLALDGLWELHGDCRVLTEPGMFPALTELQMPVSGAFSASALADAIRERRLPRLALLQLSGRNDSASVVPIAEAVADSSIRELDVRPMWNNITVAEYQRVRELLGDRVRINTPADPDVIPF